VTPESTRGAEGLRSGLAAAVIARSFLLQSVWNRRTMQSVGFCYAMLPVLGEKRADGAAAKAFLERHLGFFNTNPVLASYVLGAAAAAELGCSGRSEHEAEATKRALSGPLGMAGDALFWAALRPLGGFLGVVALLAGKPWAAAVPLVLYNAPHLLVRVRGVLAGAARGPAAAREVLGPGVRRTVAALRAACAFAAGFVAALAVARAAAGPRGVVAAGLACAAGLVALRLRVPLSAVAIAVVVVGTALAAAGVLGG